MSETVTSQLTFDVKHNSTEDGPGVRSVIFLKGCPLSCVWCHNPEGKRNQAELLYEPDKCISCQQCVGVCPEGALTLKEGRPPTLDRDTCNQCMKCVSACPPHALQVVGQSIGVTDLVEQVLPYQTYFQTSGGGVTVSGGEPTHDMHFLGELLRQLKSHGLHTLVETSGLFNLDQFIALALPHIDMIYMDVKIIDDDEHRRLCGTSNVTILNNLVQLHNLAEDGAFTITPRTPLIPGLTDSGTQITKLAQFYQQHQITRAALLKNNPMWFNKAAHLGLTPLIPTQSPSRHLYPSDRYQQSAAILLKHGVTPGGPTH